VTRFDALARHPLAIAGALVTTASAIAFIVLVIAVLAGLLQNPYAGLVVFVAIPAVFVIGLALIPAGMWLQQRKLRRHPEAAAGWPVLDFREPRVRRRALAIAALTAVNVIILLLGGYGGLHWMESPSFCGQACHVPMTPQFTAWQAGPHAKIACVSCHIGEGARGFVQAKLAGTRQLAHVITGSFPTPIPPGAHMAPGAQAQTCLGCHQPLRIGRDRIRVIREYASDEANTETLTVFQMHMGGPSAGGKSIHWHADPANRVDYVASGDGQTIPYVKVTDASGRVKEYRTADGTNVPIPTGTPRTMDCIDCHNTGGHPFSPTAEKAVDDAIAAGLVSRALPYVRREGVRLLSATYPNQDAALAAIDRELREFYGKQAGADPRAAISAVQDLYRRNVSTTMQVTWGAYPNHLGHVAAPGCGRCHDDGHTASDGTSISGDCELCHKEVERPKPSVTASALSGRPKRPF
jgi:hypothetical protein